MFSKFFCLFFVTKDGVDTIYVREDKIMQNTGVGLYRDFKFCGLDWQVIDEDAETTTLLAKFCLNKEIIKEVFASDEYDSDYDVKFIICFTITISN